MSGPTFAASRRAFLGMSAAAFAAYPLASAAGMGRGLSASPFYKVVYDERFAACRSFAKEAERLGARIQGIRGDVTSLWYDDLYHCWKRDGVRAIAGLTLEPAAFCLKAFGRDAGLTQSLRCDHRNRDGAILHTISAPRAVVERAAALLPDRADWGVNVARLVIDAGGRLGAMDRARLPLCAHRRDDDAEHLVSWIVAPRNQPISV